MVCRDFENHLQAMLDSKIDPLSSEMDRHRRSCSSCQLLHKEMVALRKALQQLPRPVLSLQAEIHLKRDVSKALRPSTPVSQKHLLQTLADFLGTLRWGRVAITGLCAVVALLSIIELSTSQLTTNASLETPVDVDMLMEEHQMAIDSGIFPDNVQFSNIIASSEEK